MADENDDDAQYSAIVEYITSCPRVSEPRPTKLSELGDGVALFEVLAEIAPTHFDPTTIARELGDNWALKSSNIRKLIRNLETYYHEILSKDADFSTCVDAIPEISRNNSPEAIISLFELIVAAAVTCENRGEFVERIMDMSEGCQLAMKEIIERSLDRLIDYEHVDGNDGLSEDEENEMIFDDDDSYDLELNGKSNAISGTPSSYRILSPGTNNTLNSPIPSSGLFHSAVDISSIAPDDPYKTSGEYAAFSPAEIIKERDELRRALQDVRRELAAQMSQAELTQQEGEAMQRKLRALADDMQSRLGQRQDELTAAEGEIIKLKRQVEDSQNNVSDLKSQKDALADELDLANAKNAQLRRAEATVVAYKKKLDNAGAISQQMADLEDQAANYMRQVVALEKEGKQVPVLQKRVDELQQTNSKLENESMTIKEEVKNKNEEILRLKEALRESEKREKMFESELVDRRQDEENRKLLSDDGGNDPLKDCYNSFTSAQSISETKEKVLRLEIENKYLNEQIKELQASAAGEQTASEDERALKASIHRLKEELKKREFEKEKLSGEKEKLEAYTKKTLAKFQEKYLVALQECKAKLKEKHDKIEQLENRSAAEKNAQKREERLLSSTIYELGLVIMQQKLKERQG